MTSTCTHVHTSRPWTLYKVIQAVCLVMLWQKGQNFCHIELSSISVCLPAVVWTTDWEVNQCHVLIILNAKPQLTFFQMCVFFQGLNIANTSLNAMIIYLSIKCAYLLCPREDEAAVEENSCLTGETLCGFYNNYNTLWQNNGWKIHPGLMPSNPVSAFRGMGFPLGSRLFN